jgi:hypothetical protein
MQEEAFQRAKQRDLEEGQIRSLTLQNQMENIGRRVIPDTNMVSDTAPSMTTTDRITRQMTGGGTPAPSAPAAAANIPPYLQPNAPDAQAPSVQDLANLPQTGTAVQPTLQPTTTTSLRPVDKSRGIATFNDPTTGQRIQWERYTPEEMQAREVQRQVSLQSAIEMAKMRIANQAAAANRQATLEQEGGGVPARGLTSVGIPDGTLLTRAEFQAHTEAAQSIAAKNRLTLKEGESVYNLTPGTPGTPGIPGTQAGPGAGLTPIASVPPKQTPEEDALDSYAIGHFKKPDGTPMTSRKDMNVLQNAAARSWFKATNADPDLRNAALATKASADAAREEAIARGRATLSEAQTRDLDRQIKQYGDPYQKMVTGADAQLDKVLDAEKLLAGGAVGQALGIPKILSALVGGQGSGVRITQAELQSIARARGIGGDIEGFFNRLSGQGTLTAAQKQQMQGLLSDVRDRINQKRALANSVLDDMNGATSREDVMRAEKRGRAGLGGGSAAPAAGTQSANPYR